MTTGRINQIHPSIFSSPFYRKKDEEKIKLISYVFTFKVEEKKKKKERLTSFLFRLSFPL